MGRKRIKACLLGTVALVTLLYCGAMLDIRPSVAYDYATHHTSFGPQAITLKTYRTSTNMKDSVKFLWSESALNETVKQIHHKFKSQRKPQQPTDIFLKTFVGLAKARENKTLWRQLDVMHLPLHTFDPEFQNPCWWSNTTVPYTCVYQTKRYRSVGWRHISYERSHFHCLPYFLIIGQLKTGTTDLFRKIKKHPDVATTSIKEKAWFYYRLRKLEVCGSLDAYIGMFQDAADNILQHHKPGSRNPFITGDATPSYFSDNMFWDMLPGNEGCQEPCVTNAHMIHHIRPGAKLILSLRNPTDRLYSFYFHNLKRYKVLPTNTFHQLVVEEIQKFNKCLESQTVRGCCYNYTDNFESMVDLRQGIYHVYLSDWLEVFPRDQMHIIKFEDYIVDGSQHLADIFKFLKLRDLSWEELDSIDEIPQANRRTAVHRQIGDMWNSTRSILNAFYKPFNHELAALLADTKYVW